CTRVRTAYSLPASVSSVSYTPLVRSDGAGVAGGPRRAVEREDLERRVAAEGRPRGLGEALDVEGPGPAAHTQVVVEHEQPVALRSEEHTSELQSRENLVCRPLLEKKK